MSPACQHWKSSTSCSCECSEVEDTSLVTPASAARSLFRWGVGGEAGTWHPLKFSM